MQVARISDTRVHFEPFLDVSKKADRTFCFGDLAGYDGQVNESINAQRQLNAVCVGGNHDSYLLHGGCLPDAPPAVRFSIDIAVKAIEPAPMRITRVLRFCNRVFVLTLARRCGTIWIMRQLKIRLQEQPLIEPC